MTTRPTPSGRCALFLIAAMCAGVLIPPVGPGAWARGPAVEPEAPEYEVKAAFLFNFTRFVQWPDSALADSTVVIGLFVEDETGTTIERILSGSTIAGRRILVRRNPPPALRARCLLIFVDQAHGEEAPAILTSLGRAPVLTVGESEEFLDAGGIIRFRTVDRRIRFAVNLAAARSRGLLISSKLLSVAETVTRDNAGGGGR